MRRVSKKRQARRQSAAGQADLDHMRAVKQRPCCVCGAPGPSDAHHCIHDRYGMAKASDRHTIPLCKSCHQDGPLAIHRNKRAWRERNGPDWARLPPDLQDDYLKEKKPPAEARGKLRWTQGGYV